ncbi:MAG TPA: hypothetical protein VMR81_03190 [Patescibacteria group bacterium]|nr:hypothetical protein [Patescibacteria group bacterium]
MKKDYLHLKEVDRQELLVVLLGYFGNASSLAVNVQRYQKAGSKDFLIVEMDKESKIQKVSLSSHFPVTKLEEIESLIEKTLLKKNSSVGHTILFCHEPINGYFIYKDEFQILPVPKEAPRPEVSWADHPFVLEFRYEGSDNPSVDSIRKGNKITTYTRILNLLLNRSVSAGWKYARFEWIYNTDDIRHMTSQWKQVGYTFQGVNFDGSSFTSIVDIPELKRVANTDYYKEFYRGTGELQLPDNLESSLDSAFNLPEELYKKFFMSISWLSFYNHLWNVSASSAFIALVSAIECLIRNSEICNVCHQNYVDELDFCPNCKQQRYGLTRSFKEFLVDFIPNIKSFPIEKNTLYNTRSQLAHGLELLMSDLQPWGFIMGAKEQEQRDLQSNLYRLTKIGIYNWLQVSGQK